TLKALQIGVYDRHGTPIQRGAERSVRDLYLYDFEVKAIAGALVRHQTYGMADLARLISRVTGKQISAEVIGSTLQAGINTAVGHPTDPSSLIPMLIRDLGVGNGSASTAQLNAVQYFLLTASFLGEPLRQASAAHPAAVAAGGPCPTVTPDPNT